MFGLAHKQPTWNILFTACSFFAVWNHPRSEWTKPSSFENRTSPLELAMMTEASPCEAMDVERAADDFTPKDLVSLVFEQVHRGFKHGCTLMMRKWLAFVTASGSSVSGDQKVEAQKKERLAARLDFFTHSAEKRTMICAQEVVVFLAAQAAACVVDDKYVPPRIRLVVEHEDAADTFALATISHRGMNKDDCGIDGKFAMSMMCKGTNLFAFRCLGESSENKWAECVVDTYKNAFDRVEHDVRDNDLFIYMCSSVKADDLTAAIPDNCHGWMAIGTPTGIWNHVLKQTGVA
jgi:hypothetical protein